MVTPEALASVRPSIQGIDFDIHSRNTEQSSPSASADHVNPGTVLFLFFALSGTQVANSIPSSAGLTVAQTGANPQQLQYIALCFGFSLAVNAWVFFRISGGLFNPAVTLGLALVGALPWIRGVLLFFTQILGGLAAAALVSCMFPGGLNVQTTLGGGTTIVQGVFIEMILTAQLVFTIFMLAAEHHRSTYLAPVGQYNGVLSWFSMVADEH